MSIVIPCFNGERFVAEAVASALGQSVPVDVVVVDDGSTDESRDVVDRIIRETDGDRLTSIAKANGGVADARNVGLGAIGTEFVMFLDADDVLRPDAAEVLLDRLQRSPDLVAAAGATSRMDETGATTEPAPEVIEVHELGRDGRVRVVTGVDRVGFWNLIPVTAIRSPGQALVRADELRSIGGFDVALRSAEDWDMWLRLSHRGDIGLVHHWVLRYRDHQGGKSKQHQVSRRYRRQIYDQHIAAADPADRSLVTVARRYGMYGFDMRACAGWSVDELRAGHLGNAARLGIRSGRYGAKLAVAAVRDRWSGDGRTT